MTEMALFGFEKKDEVLLFLTLRSAALLFTS